MVFSAQAEVFLLRRTKEDVMKGFLRASGGVSWVRCFMESDEKFSPRKRRCFSSPSMSTAARAVFSAQAEVFPLRHSLAAVKRCFLRASGGVSLRWHQGQLQLSFSPRKRRCFLKHRVCIKIVVVFSAQAEVFLFDDPVKEGAKSFLRASGGVSTAPTAAKAAAAFSPRKRRCFYGEHYKTELMAVFSAQAEVFPLGCIERLRR